MKILRVETFDTKGPYMPGGPIGPVTYANDGIHPTPGQDTRLGSAWKQLASTENWFFGFFDKSQFLEWFPKKEWKPFYEHNHKHRGNQIRLCGLSTYDVDSGDLILGSKQVIFRLDRAERLKFEVFRRGDILQKIYSAIAR
jgi:hypothetical protein